MNLRELLRNDFSDYIRRNFVKDACEFCGSTNEIHLHHIDKFHNLLMETLGELKLQELDSEDYDEMELKSIRNFMLAKQIRCEYKTLCKSCHMKLHGKEKYSDEYMEHYYNPYGGYIIVNIDKVKNIDSSMLFRYLKLCVNMNYDNYICNKKPNGKQSRKIKYENLNDLLGLGNTELYRTLKYFKDEKLISITDEKYIKINKNIATKGFCNYKNKYNIFINNINELYYNVGNFNHKLYGNTFKLLFESEHNYIDLDIQEITIKLGQANESNASRIFKKVNTPMKLIIKINKNRYMINPWLGYNSGFNNLFKDEIEKFYS